LLKRPEFFSVQVDLHAVCTSSAYGLHKALHALVAWWKVGRLDGDLGALRWGDQRGTVAATGRTARQAPA
jgi:hypothetical protein